jgi:hypothetical protein
MKQLAILFSLGFLLISCDPVYRAEIENKTDQQIFIEIAFNQQELEKLWGGRPYLPFLKSYPNDGSVDNAIKFDTINLVKTYKIQPGSSFPLTSGIGSHPEYNLFKKLRVLYSDTLVYNNRDQIEKAFREIKTRYWAVKVR